MAGERNWLLDHTGIGVSDSRPGSDARFASSRVGSIRLRAVAITLSPRWAGTLSVHFRASILPELTFEMWRCGRGPVSAHCRCWLDRCDFGARPQLRLVSVNRSSSRLT
jgi:hypothetical protein